MIRFEFQCDADDCTRTHRFSLLRVSRHRGGPGETVFDAALRWNKEEGWHLLDNGKELPDFDIKVFCPDHQDLHRDKKGT